MVAPKKVSAALAYALLTLTMAIWGGALVVARGIHELAPPVGLTFWRWLLASLILLPLVWRKLPALKQAGAARLTTLLLLGIFMVLGTTLSVTAVNFTTAINATLINAAQAAMTSSVAFLLLRERLVRAQVAGITCAFIGILVMVFRGDLGQLAQIEFNWGDLIMILAIVSWACYAVLLHRAPGIPSGDVLLFAIAVVGVVTLAPLYALETHFIRDLVPSARTLSGIVYLAIASTVLAIHFWNLAIRAVGASRAAMFVNLVPVFGALFATLFLNERLYGYHLVGGVLVFIGIVLAVRKRFR